MCSEISQGLSILELINGYKMVNNNLIYMFININNRL